METQSGNSNSNFEGDKLLSSGREIVAGVVSIIALLKDRVPEETGEVWVQKGQGLKAWAPLQSDTYPGTVKTRNIIALCGDTGSGKSTFANAIVEDDIVSTSCVNACTAVVTEIGYKKSRGIEAEVHFMSREGWADELGHLKEDIKNAPKSVDSKNFPAQIAWKKVQAVYPALTVKDLMETNVESILQRNEAVTAKLGTVQFISAVDSKDFAVKRRDFIESGSRFAAQSSPGHAFWPLIKLVKIRCNAEALSSGTLLVDLPGTGDSNPARNAIARDYLKNAHSIWVLAPATRACDDAYARESLRNAVTTLFPDGRVEQDELQVRLAFIATRSDETTATEIVNSLGLDQAAEYQNLLESIKSETQQLGSASPSKRTRMDDSDTAQTATKRRRAGDGEDSVDGCSTSNIAIYSPMEVDSPFVQSDQAGIRRIRSFCARKRSEYIREELQKNFRLLLKEQDALANYDEPDFDSDDSVQEYDNVALPVYTCSAGDFIKLMNTAGPDTVDGPPRYFTSRVDIGGTGIPELRRLCHHLAERTESREAASFLKRVQELVLLVEAQLQAFIQEDAALRQFRARWNQEVPRDRPAGGAESKGFEVDLRTVARNAGATFISEWQSYVENKSRKRLLDAATTATDAAPGIVAKFTRTRTKHHVPVGEDIMHYRSFQAALRRQGAWKGRQGTLDLNGDLAKAMLNPIATLWARLQREEYFTMQSERLIDKIYKKVYEIESSVPQTMRVQFQELAEAALNSARLSINSAMAETRRKAEEMQRELPKGVEPFIKTKMLNTYRTALREFGRDCVVRQQEIVTDDVESRAEELYNGAAAKLLKDLDETVEISSRKVEKELQVVAKRTARTMSLLWDGEEPDDNNANLFQRAHVEVQSFEVELQHLFEEYERAILSA